MPRISWWRTSFGEEDAEKILDSLRHEHVSQGPVVAEFESALAAYLGVPYVIATTSGSSALLMAMIALGIGPGDEVIVPNRTWIATAHAPRLLGAKVVLADVESNRPAIEAKSLNKLITSRTKAVIPVHLNGRTCDMREVNAIAASNGIKVVEDAAQAFASRNQDGFLGLQSDIGCFSLSVAKLLATGQGGFAVTHDPKTAAQLRLIRTHGVENVTLAQWGILGFNFRFTDLLASIGVVQLRKISKNMDRVKAIHHLYAAALQDHPYIQLIPVDTNGGEIPIYVEALCEKRDALINHLASHDIEARPFYPDLDRAQYFGHQGNFINSRRFSENGLYLPSGPAQSDENIGEVLEVLKNWRHS